jgi:preprotein translocase subunit SecG
MEKVTVFLIAFFIAGTIFLPSVRRRKRRHDKGSIGE